MASAERPIQQQQQQQHVLKCPRCHSSNTKFCYYNNYSLSQPRHFCKACKRYWTRGGTLRNVPVGGGCRKNKRIKRSTFTTVDDCPNPNPNLDHTPPSNNNLNPLYHGLLQQNPKFPRFDTTREHSRYDLLIQPQMNSLGLGFSSSDPGDPLATHAHNSVSLVSNYPSSIFSDGFASRRNNSDHTMSSTTIPSSLNQQPTFLRFGPYGDQMEGPKGSTDWNNSLNGQNHNDKIKALESSDPISLLWTIAGGDDEEWCDPTSNISNPSLI